MAGAGVAVGSAALAQPLQKPPIILGQVSLSFYAVTGAIVHEVLERLGHTVEVREGPHEAMFPLLSEGKIDIMAAVWLPEGHATYWAKYGQSAEELAEIYQGAKFFWAVPSYVPESEVRSIEDLRKPNVAAKLTKQIQGIGRGATISVLSQRAIADYGLAQSGFSFKSGTQADWIEEYNRATAERRWIVFPTWTPQYLNLHGELRALSDPKGILGGENHGSLAGAKSRLEAIPSSTTAVLRRIDIGRDGVERMDWLVNVDKKVPREAARIWMREEQERVKTWFDT